MHVQRFTLTFALGNALLSELNEGQWVAAARLEQDHVQVYVTAAARGGRRS